MTTTVQVATPQGEFKKVAAQASRQITNLTKVSLTSEERDRAQQLRNELTAARKAFQSAASEQDKVEQVVKAHEIGNRAKVLATELKDQHEDAIILPFTDSPESSPAPVGVLFALAAAIAFVVLATATLFLLQPWLSSLSIPEWGRWGFTAAAWGGVFLVPTLILIYWRSRVDSHTEKPDDGRKEDVSS